MCGGAGARPAFALLRRGEPGGSRPSPGCRRGGPPYPMQIDTSQAHPAMDYRAHFDTYRGFIRFAVWGSVLCAILLAGMAYFLVP